jgi:ABC-type nitrate/sulfonate/bicarbonate transport system ATPase subunit
MELKLPDNPEIKDFIQQNGSLFWWVKPEERVNISINSMIEAVLNYGDEKSIKKLFDLVGIKIVAAIFNRQISGKRSNYRKRTQNYFKLYFKRHAQ